MADGGIVFPHGEWDVARMLQQVRFYVFVSETSLLSLNARKQCTYAYDVIVA